MLQGGLSLVELMIAMVIGLIVMAGLAQILLSGRQSYSTQSGVGALQENGRFATFFLQRDISKAGFPRTTGPSTGAPTVTPFVVPTLPGTGTFEGVDDAPDQIEMQFHSDPSAPFSFQDCLGQAARASFAGGCAAGTVDETDPAGDGCVWQVTNRYWVQNGSLMCRGVSPALAYVGDPPGQQIVRGVESMQILYGVDTDNDSYANVYRNATQVGAANWNSVVSVRVALLLNSQEAVADTADTQEYALLDAAPITPVDDAATAVDELRMRRRVFTTTIEIRNRTE